MSMQVSYLGRLVDLREGVRVPESTEPANVDQRVLLGGHGEHVPVREHLAHHLKRILGKYSVSEQPLEAALSLC